MAPGKKTKGKEEGEPVTLSGVYMFPNGDRYEGEYQQNNNDGGLERKGEGTHITSDGVKYVGQWDQDKMNGKGRIDFPSGTWYEGDFVNNMFHGQGRYVWPNGSAYVGDFHENKLQGQGEFKDTDNQTWSGAFRYKAAPALRFKLSL